jgi:hypothetical protein
MRWRGRIAVFAAAAVLACDRSPAAPAPVPTSSAEAAAAPAKVSARPPPQASAVPSRTKHGFSAPRPAVSAVGPDGAARRCREQRPQEFLLRRGYIIDPKASAAERRRRRAARRRAEEYRTRQYGYFPGFGRRQDNPRPPRAFARRTTFMGLVVVMHRKVVPALACVEQALRRDCTHVPYQPERISGLREHNTYKDYEVSNHVYGIALDIDSDKNPCCGCVGKWREAKACRKQVDSPYDRMAMPRCWVEVFERYGFHWLGHDELEDTMHFEFLGDPDRIFE